VGGGVPDIAELKEVAQVRGAAAGDSVLLVQHCWSTVQHSTALYDMATFKIVCVAGGGCGGGGGGGGVYPEMYYYWSCYIIVSW